MKKLFKYIFVYYDIRFCGETISYAYTWSKASTKAVDYLLKLMKENRYYPDEYKLLQIHEYTPFRRFAYFIMKQCGYIGFSGTTGKYLIVRGYPYVLYLWSDVRNKFIKCL